MCVMKKTLLSLIILLMLSCNQVFAANMSKYTKDTKILSALKILEKIESLEIFSNLDEKKVKIIFYDFSNISFSYSNHYAMTSIDNFGDRYILINAKYQNAPIEAIACLIVHESYHKLNRATLEEEVRATQAEAEFWAKVKPAELEMENKLVMRLNKLETLYKNSTKQTNLIQEEIENNTFYQKQLAMKN